jgi:hypothetical protein
LFFAHLWLLKANVEFCRREFEIPFSGGDRGSRKRLHHGASTQPEHWTFALLSDLEDSRGFVDLVSHRLDSPSADNSESAQQKA